MYLVNLSAALAALMTLNLHAAEPQGQAALPPPAELATAPAEHRTVPREYRLDGVVEAANRTTVSAQTQGQVEEVLFDVDDTVEKGQLVVRLKDTEQRARLAQASADQKSAAAQLEQARDEQARIAGLFAKHNVSDSAMDQATADLASAQAGLESATARLEQAKEQLDYTQIRAPYAGIVTHRHVQVGEIATPGAPVMSGVSLEQLRVIVDVPQSVIPSVRAGGVARVYLPDGGVVATEAITVFPFADLGSNTFKVRVDLPAPAPSLFPGMYVKTGFAVGERSELVIPAQAVVQRSEVTGVYTVAEDGLVRFRQIRLGRVLTDGVAVLAGLSEGERVALDPIAAGVVLKSQTARRLAGAGGGHG
jgi:RND family efflux transporter MFP subunit